MLAKDDSKNVNKQQAGANNNDLISVINFIEQAMTTLSRYGKHLKTQIDFNLV